MDVVLIVEDEVDLQEQMADALRANGYEVILAANGTEALAALQSAPLPSLILLDLMMPGMNGSEFREAQLLDPALAKVPVVVVSGAGDVGRSASDIDALGYLIKPFRRAELLTTVAHCCRH